MVFGGHHQFEQSRESRNAIPDEVQVIGEVLDAELEILSPAAGKSSTR